MKGVHRLGPQHGGERHVPDQDRERVPAGVPPAGPGEGRASAGIKFPLFVRDYFTWVEPAGTRVFLVLPAPDGKRPMGIAFRRDQQGSATPSHMCDWCHSYGSSNEIGMLTTDVSSKRRVGVNLCLDLRCKEKLEAAANLSGRNPRDYTDALMERMTHFAREALGSKPSRRIDPIRSSSPSRLSGLASTRKLGAWAPISCWPPRASSLAP